MNYQITINGSIGGWPNVASAIKPVIADNADKHIDVLITSPGGSVFEALAIRDLFAEHGDVTVHIHGYAASAATVIAMGAKKIVMSKYALFLVHQVSNWIDEWGYLNSNQIQELIDSLSKTKDESDKLDLLLAKIYADRTGNSLDTMHELMVQNVWLSAEEALENHLIDEIVNSGNAPVIDSCTRDMFNSLDIPVPDRFNSPIASDGLMEKLIACISILSNKINNLSMKKVFNLALLCTLLNRASFEAEEDVVSVSCQDLNNIENHLVALSESIASKETEISTLNATIDERNAEINSLNARIDELNAQIVALQKAPAVDPEEVFEEGDDVVSCVDILNSLS